MWFPKFLLEPNGKLQKLHHLLILMFPCLGAPDRVSHTFNRFKEPPHYAAVVCPDGLLLRTSEKAGRHWARQSENMKSLKVQRGLETTTNAYNPECAFIPVGLSISLVWHNLHRYLTVASKYCCPCWQDGSTFAFGICP